MAVSQPTKKLLIIIEEMQECHREGIREKRKESVKKCFN
jgi:hypothetical protein